MSRICKSIETENRLFVALGCGVGIGLTANWHKKYFGGDENVLKLDCNQGYTTL